jgi:hypothetical protein
MVGFAFPLVGWSILGRVLTNTIAARHSFHRDGDLFRGDRWVEWIMLGIAEH